MNKAIFWGFLARSWSFLAGLVTVSLVTGFFTPEQQGYYYTFGSLLALQIFFELGLTNVLVQFAGCEFAKIHWLQDGELEGDSVAIQRFLTLSKKGVFWFGVASILFIAILAPVGLSFFQQCDSGSFAWRIPWLLAVAGTAMNLASVPFWGVLTGAGQIHLANKRSLLGGLLGCALAWIGIYCGYGLYSVFMIAFGNAVFSWGLLFFEFRKFLRRILCHRSDSNQVDDISWGRDIWPMQWRIALSWASGYFIFQLFTPVLFTYQGAKIAGQMGLTLAMRNAILAVAMVWTGARNPEMCRLIALKDWPALDALFRRLMGETTLVVLGASSAGLGLVWYLQGIPRFAERFLSLDLVAVQLFSTLLAIWGDNMATYCRAHKVEPFLGVSIISAVAQGCLTWITGKYYSVDSLVYASMWLNLLFGLPMAVYIWQNQRKSHIR
ncbi:MAG TPA: hypothetical protein PLU72_09330 [Candidatus Ozemobacteraceae bacterium]|nr:hypothetical protein [Candidatus Ozemobacteraceae bacterium]